MSSSASACDLCTRPRLYSINVHTDFVVETVVPMRDEFTIDPVALITAEKFPELSALEYASLLARNELFRAEREKDAPPCVERSCATCWMTYNAYAIHALGGGDFVLLLGTQDGAAHVDMKAKNLGEMRAWLHGNLQDAVERIRANYNKRHAKAA
jgi:hypothetical protein